MNNNIWSESYKVSSFLVNPQKKLGLFGLLNLIQDVAWEHATHLGHGYEKMIQDNIGWVLTRQKLKMSRWPVWGESIELKTWIRPIKGMIAIRDFEFFSGGNKIGECSTQWLILDLITRRPSERNLNLDDVFSLDAPVNIDATKIAIKSELSYLSEFKVRNSDLDLNAHVNNTRYAQWILDSISQHKHTEFFLNGYEVNFIAEAKAGDSVSILSTSLIEDQIQFQGIRTTDKKVIFVSTLKVTAGQLAPDCNQS